MGINTYNYLIFPKIIAFTLSFGDMHIHVLRNFWWLYSCVYGGFSTSGEFIQGIQLDFTLSMLLMHS